MSAIVKEVSNDNVVIRLHENGSISFVMRKPGEMTRERFMTHIARLEKILDAFNATAQITELVNE